MKSIRNTQLVVKREYVKVIRKPTFWISTLLFPAFIIVISLISGLSAEQSKNALNTDISSINTIYVQDKTPENFIKLKEFPGDNSFNAENAEKIKLITTEEQVNSAIEEVKTGKSNALIIYPDNFLQNFTVIIYSDQNSPITREKYNSFADILFKKNIIAQIKEQDLMALYSVPLQHKVISYQNGVVDTRGIEMYIVPYASMIIYILLVSFATSYLLLSVSEEKENRMIETVLSIIKPSELITGKIIGQVGIIFTQVLLLIGTSLIVLAITSTKLPIDLSALQILPGQIIMAFIYIFLGFIFLSAVMVGVGAATPNYKDAQSMSSIFILIAMIPVYFVMIIMMEPNGTVAMITSYLPFTSSIVLLFRNALVTLPWWEIALSIVSQIIYVVLAVILAYKLFEVGSLEYSQRLSLNSLKAAFKKKQR